MRRRLARCASPLAAACIAAACDGIWGIPSAETQMASSSAPSSSGAATIVGMFESDAATTPDSGPADRLLEATPDGSVDSGIEDAVVGEAVESSDGATDGGCSACPVLPSLPDGMRPRLWLSADRGLTCSAGQVSLWQDLSGNADDATLINESVGPLCQLSPPHLLNGIDIPYFSAPNNGNVVDGTLDVDLTFLEGSSYSIFAVERRLVPTSSPAPVANFILGTEGPYQGALNGCTDNPNQYSALQFGYAYYAGPELVVDHTCYGLQAASIPAPAPISYDSVRFSPSLGIQLYVDGSEVAASLLDNMPLQLASNGSIGRAYSTTLGSDARFVGDIAEVLVYDTALGDPDRLTIEQYLRDHWALESDE